MKEVRNHYHLRIDPNWISDNGFLYVPFVKEETLAGYTARIDVRDAEVNRRELNTLDLTVPERSKVLLVNDDGGTRQVPFITFLHAVKEEYQGE